MMERILLVLLCLSGWYICPTRPVRQYHYVPDKLTWSEAQTYCRLNYTDLATIEDDEQVKQVISTLDSSVLVSSNIWIGLHSFINWQWSDGYTATGNEYRPWQYQEPNFNNGEDLCVFLSRSGQWADSKCKGTTQFFCNKGTQLKPEFVLVEQAMSWENAQSHCRSNYVDLATVRNSAENDVLVNMMLMTSRAWIGLFRRPDTSWSDGSRTSFTKWRQYHVLGTKAMVCGTSTRLGQWELRPCDEKYPFLCHIDSQLVTKRVIKLRIKVENSVDPNDPAMKAAILKQLQDMLDKNGGGGATLSWVQQNDGKVFLKELKSSDD